MRWLWICVFFFSVTADAQIIINFAGGGTVLGDGGPATNALVSAPVAGAFDKFGNFYFSQAYGGNRIRKVDTLGIISTFAGTGVSGYNGDGIPATDAQINMPIGIKFDSIGNLFIADANNHRIRKVDAVTGIITTIAGNGTPGFGGDGNPASASVLNYPQDVCFDKFGNFYIADLSNNRVRKVNTVGVMSTYAGNGTGISTGDGGPATAATTSPWGLCADDLGNIYIAEGGIGLCRVRKVNASGVISTVAGNGTSIYSGDEVPATSTGINPVQVFYFNHELYIVDQNNNRIRKLDASGVIHTLAGDGGIGYLGDGGPATAAQIYHPAGVALDTCGNVYIADNGNRHIRKVIVDTPCYVNRSPLNIGLSNSIGEIKIYPNPIADELYIEYLKTNTEYKLHNLMGALQQHGNLKQGNNTISLKHVPPGMYILVFTDEEGRKVVKRFVKE